MKSSPLLRSFFHAWRGLRLGFRAERSFRLQMAAALFIMAASAFLPLAAWERVALLVVVMFVLVLELLNSSIERIVDLAKPRYSELAGDIKDLMAGAVLLGALFAVIIGLIILGPRLLTLFGLV